MKRNNRQPKRACRSVKEFEELFLPKTHAHKHQETVMKDPVKFGEHLKEKLMKSIRK
jgi:hypothetical protein